MSLHENKMSTFRSISLVLIELNTLTILDLYGVTPLQKSSSVRTARTTHYLDQNWPECVLRTAGNTALLTHVENPFILLLVRPKKERSAKELSPLNAHSQPKKMRGKK